MDDLKSVTVEYLRDLARKHLGKGHSKLRSKAQLVAALAVAVPALAALAKLAGVKVPGKKKAAGAKGAVKAKGRKDAPARKAAPASKPVVDGRKSAVTDEKKAAKSNTKPAKAGKAGPTVKPAQVVNFPPKARTAARPEPEEAPAPSAAAFAAPTPAEPPPAPPEPQHDAEPLVEGFFVARIRGEDEARRHHLTEAQGHGTQTPWDLDEHLGVLPLDYGDDAAVALARDPHSLYVTWDFSEATRARAVDGLEAPRAVLRVFDGESLVREVDFALESRSFYIHGLPSGRAYRVEAHFVGRDGRSRRIGHSTNRVVLPRVGPSTDTSVRFMRMPVRLPAANVEQVAAAAPRRSTTVEEREYITWRRVPLPGSGGFEDLPDVRRERLTTEAEGPGAPQHLDVPARAPGSSEQQYLAVSSRPQGSSEQRYLEVSRPEGSSEWRYLEVSREEASSERPSPEVRRAEGSSDTTTWTPPPSGRGRQ